MKSCLKYVAGIICLSLMFFFTAAEYVHALTPGNYNPSIANDPVGGRYLVVYEVNDGTQADIKAQLFNSDGSFYGGEITVSAASGDQFFPKTSFDPVTQRYLVVWQDERNVSNADIYGRLVNSDGSAYSAEFVVSNASLNQVSPAVAYDSVNQRFFVVWGDYRTAYSAIYGQVVNSDGSLNGTEKVIYSTGSNNEYPSVAFDSLSQRFFVVWHDVMADDIAGRMLTSGGDAYGPYTLIVAGINSQNMPSISFDPLNSRYLLVWQDNRAGLSDYEIYGRLFDSSGSPYGAEIHITQSLPDNQQYPDVVYDPAYGRFMAAWQDFRADGLYPDIYAQLINMDGTLSGTEFAVSTASSYQFYPQSAFNPACNNIMTTYETWELGSPSVGSAIIGNCRFKLQVTTAGTGMGSVSSSPAGIGCGPNSVCSALFDKDSLVTLTATSSGGSYFTGWGGACTGNTSTCDVTMNAATDVTSDFASCFSIYVTPSFLVSGSQGVSYSQTVNANGGTPPYTMSVSSGSMPLGLSMLQGTQTSADIYGTPTESGTFNFTVSAVDANGCSANQPYSLMINSADTTPPTVYSVIPSPGYTNVPLNADVVITWSENINCGTVSYPNITVSGGSLNYWGCSGNQTIFHTAGQTANTTYTVTVTTAVQDLAGNSMSADYQWSFTTGCLTGGSMQCADPGFTTSNGFVTTLAGAAGSSGDVDAAGASARFNYPSGMSTDGINLFVADTYNHKIRKIDIGTGAVTTLAGSGAPGSIDDAGAAASFYLPYGVTTDGANLFVADTYNHKIRKIDISTGAVTTLAGSGAAGSTDSTGTAASFDQPYGVTTDGKNIYVADYGNNKIRKIVISSADVTTLAGSGGMAATDGTGISASFYQPAGITTDGTNLFVADYFNNKIRKIEINTAVVTTLAGSGTAGSTDASGAAAQFNYPDGITTDGLNLYVADSWNHTIRKIAPDNVTPAVVSVSPTNNSTAVSVNSTVSATFSEAMDPATINASTFTLGNGATGTVIYDSGTKTATYTPSANFAYNTTYTATITTGVKDMAGNALPLNYPWSFTTETAPTFTITSTAGANGSITPAGSTVVSYNGSQSYTISANTGYHVLDVLVDGVSAGAVTSYTFSGVTGNHTIDASFAIDTYTVTPSAGTGGSISPNTAQSVTNGLTTSFTVTPGTGYSISSVTGCSGTLSGSTYTTGAITSNCTVSASFAISTYAITSSAGTGGTVACSPSTVNYGSNSTCTITANTGYSISGVTVDGSSAGAISSYTFTSVSANHSINASFTSATYSITTSAGSGGYITCDSSTVTYGSSVSCTVVPYKGFKVAAVYVNGVAIGKVNSLKLSNVTGNYSINALFMTSTVGKPGKPPRRW